MSYLGVIPCQFTRALHTPTLNYLKFGTNILLHEFGKTAKLFCARPYKLYTKQYTTKFGAQRSLKFVYLLLSLSSK